MSNRDELAGELARHIIGTGYEARIVKVSDAHNIAAAILAAGYRKPRTITTVEDLESLSEGSAVLDRHGDVSTKHAHWWHTYETSPMMSQRVAKYGPLTVIYEPSA